LATGGLAQDFTTGPTPAPVTLTANSTLDLGTALSATSVKFADSHLATWGMGVVLSIDGWTFGTDHLLVGNDATGFSSAQLAEIKFADFAQGASISTTGELTPQLGDINQDGVTDVADIKALMVALSDEAAYRTSHSFTASDTTFILDVDQNGSVSNADIQAEINLLANLGGGGGGSVAAVPEPMSVLLMISGGLIIATRRVRAIASGFLMKP